MATQGIGVVLVRLFSIYLAINALQTLFYFLPNMFTTDVGLAEGLLSASFWFLALGILLPAACAYWLWNNVEVVVPKESISNEPSMDVSHGLLLGVTLIGLWLLVWGLVSLVRVESSLVATESMSDELKLAQRAPYMAQIIISLPLLFAKERVVAMLLWAKYAGRKRG
jgi:hypothetical protein